MKKRDARKLDSVVQQELRYLAIELFERNKSQVEIAQIMGVSLSAVRLWVKIYRSQDFKGLVLKKRGIKIGIHCKLSLKQIEILKETLIKNTPDQFDLNFNLWTRHAIQLLIIKLWNIKLSLRSIGRYMKRLGFTPQKPIKIAYEQNPKNVKKWLKIDYPEIVKKAKKEGAEIHWVDETGLNSNSNYLRGYSPIGKTPIIRMKAKRFGINVISSVTNRGKMRFMTYEEGLNTKMFIQFIGRLCIDLNRKVFVIMDNLAVHHSKKFKTWLEKRKDEIEAFYLPSYSPELNPDERLNRDLKTHFHSGSLAKSKKDLKNEVVSYLRGIQKTQFRIKNYFTSKDVKYAA